VSAASHGGRRKPVHEEHADERWLLTYSDMITLLMALFLVLWAISSVNMSKFSELKVSLHQAFSGKVLEGSGKVLTGGQSSLAQSGSPITLPMQNPPPAFKMVAIQASIKDAAKKQDSDNLRHIQQQIEQYAHTHGFASQLRTSIDERGLVIRILTDDVLFDSGQATLKKPAPLLAEVAYLISRAGIVNPVRIEGNTDNVPVSGTFHSNWELSSARANAVLEFMIANHVAPHRLSTAGYGSQNPIASNATAAGRSRNRRVSLVILRRAFR
jgi:chemotaxis protein MotB